MAAEDDDPFACFGDDDDEGNENSSAWAARTLVDQVNQRMAQREDTSSEAIQQHDPKNNTNDNGVSELNELVLWPESPPLYIGPILLVASLPYGGGRGYVAKRYLEPGTLILVEEPMIEWPDKQLGKALDLVSVQHILEHSSALAMVHDLEDFHPVKEAVDANYGSNPAQIHNMMQSLQNENKDRLEEVVQLAIDRHVTNRNGNQLTVTDIVRLLLVLRYNGLETGVYRHVAMLNHDCRFNCVKYQPTEGKSYSEVRTTRPVSAGESLTISYIPRNGLVSHATRRKHLWDQHRFDIGKELFDGEQRRMELVGNALPQSSVDHVDKSAVTFRIESACCELEDLYQEAASIAMSFEGTPTTESTQVWEQLRALEVSSQELYAEARQQLRNDRHMLLIPCLRLHLDACDLVQKDPRLTASQRIKLLCRLVASARKLLELQVAYFGRDHYDIARTNLDFAQAVEELLGRASHQLLDLGLEGMTTFEACSSVEHRARKENERIQSLYPHDVEEHIKSGSYQM